MARGIFITGTDTGVGKTLVSSAIIRLLLKQNQAVFAAKPLATGSEKQADCTLRHGDVAQMAEALGGKPVWVGFESPHPAAPSVAARWEGKQLDLMQMAKDLKFAIPDGHFAVVEGAGGLLCPAGPGISIADLARLVRDIVSPEKQVHVKSQLLADNVFRHRYIPDISKAKLDLGLEITVPLAEAIRLSVSR